MNDYVKLATYQCPICGDIHSHNAEVLLHKRLKDIKDEDTFAGLKLCEEHQQMHDDGYVAMVGVLTEDGEYPEDPHSNRSGSVMHVRRTAFKDMFGQEAPKEPMTWVSESVIEAINEIQEEAEQEMPKKPELVH